MRRKEREITDWDDIIDVLRKCSVIRLGLNTDGYPYVVPLNFGFETEGKSLTLWFHCATQGQKLELIRQNPKAGFEADCSLKLVEGERARGYTMEYESVIGHGDVEICEDSTSKRRGLTAIMSQYAPERDFDFRDDEIADLFVLRLDVVQITGKRLKQANLPPKME